MTKDELLDDWWKRLGPPWAMFDRGDGFVDILPAMRPGKVLEGVPLEIAAAIQKATWQMRKNEFFCLLCCNTGWKATKNGGQTKCSCESNSDGGKLK